MDGWNTTFLLGRPIFRGYVSFREGTSSNHPFSGDIRSLNREGIPLKVTLVQPPPPTWELAQHLRIAKQEKTQAETKNDMEIH